MSKVTTTSEDALLNLMHFCEDRDLDFFEAKLLVERVVKGDMSVAEAAAFITRHLTFREAVKVARSQIQDLKRELHEQEMRHSAWRGRVRRKPIGSSQTCRTCQVEKPIDEFARTNWRVDGTTNRALDCKACLRERYARQKESA